MRFWEISHNDQLALLQYFLIMKKGGRDDFAFSVFKTIDKRNLSLLDLPDDYFFKKVNEIEELIKLYTEDFF